MACSITGVGMTAQPLMPEYRELGLLVELPGRLRSRLKGVVLYVESCESIPCMNEPRLLTVISMLLRLFRDMSGTRLEDMLRLDAERFRLKRHVVKKPDGVLLSDAGLFGS